MKKIIPVLTICILSFNSAFCQEIEWQRTIGGSNFEILSSVQQTSDGGYILGSYSLSGVSGNKTEGCQGLYDYWIVKTDASGNIQWQNTIGGAHYDYLNYTCQTSDGGYILAGSSSSNISGDKTENTWNYSLDYWVVKVDAAGNIQWQNSIGGTADEDLASVQQTSDGGYILGGSSKSGISGDKTETSLGQDDCWVIKLDASGNIQWQNAFGGSQSDKIYTIIQTNDGGYLCGATSDSPVSADKTENSMGGKDYWAVKLDASGNIQWQNTIGGTGTDQLYSIEQTSDGGYIVGGASNSQVSGDKAIYLGGYDYWMLKLDNLGVIQWQKTFGGVWDDYARSVKQTSNGGYIVGGYSISSVSGNKTESRIGYNDYWVLRLDASGNIIWQRAFGAYNNEYLVTVQETSDQQFILGGYSHSNRSGDKSEDNVGNSDFWITKLTDKYNLITGTLFADFNNNQVQEVNEPDLPYKLVSEQTTGRIGFSRPNGDYSVSVIAPGNFTVAPSQVPYFHPVPATRNVNFSGIQQTDPANDFAYQATGTYNDLCITLSAIPRFRIGTYAYYYIHYQNYGNTTLSPDITFYPDHNLTFVFAAPAPLTVTPDSIKWNFGPIYPFQSGNILVKVSVNMGVATGTIIHSAATVDQYPNEFNVGCNYSVSSGIVLNSCDPNAISVDNDTILTTDLTSSYLDYVIYFQNTGNDTAYDIKILNNIPPQLDIYSFEYITSSHPAEINYTNGSHLLTFKFDNIYLPDSNVDEQASHGFIRYRIKPLATLTAGTIIENNAGIIFDLNDPVLTDTAYTKIVLPTGTQELNMQTSGFSVYPNPFNGQMNINFTIDNNADVKIEVINAVGQNIKTVIEEKLNSGNHRISFNTDRFPPGIYFAKMIVDGQIMVRKIVKM